MMMLGDDNKNVNNVGVAKVLAHRKQVDEENGNNDNCPQRVLNSISLIRLFEVPTLNVEAHAYYKLASFLPATAASRNNLQQLLKLQVRLPKTVINFILKLHYFVEKSVLTPPSLCMLQFFRV